MAVTLTGEVKRVTYENEETGFRVIKVVPRDISEEPTKELATGLGLRPEMVTVVGIFRAVGPGACIRATGAWRQDSKHGLQLRVETLIPIEPTTLDALERYLASGLLPGVGPGLAKRIVQRFGDKSLQVLDTEPTRLQEVSGLGPKRAASLGKVWSERRALNDLLLILQTYGAPVSLATRIVKAYGVNAVKIVERSPYRLALDIKGIGFKTADKLASSLGIAGNHPERAQAGVVHELRRAMSQGHVLQRRAELVTRTAVELATDEPHIDHGIDALMASGRVVVDGDAVYLTHLHRAEEDCVQQLKRVMTRSMRALPPVDRSLSALEERTGLRLATAQRAAVKLAVETKVAVITGGPGVGKTTIIRTIVELFSKEGLSVQLAAPTGRAARRLSESTGQQASTLHRLLEFEPRRARFLRGCDKPLSSDVLVIDEVSMVDVVLASAFLSALPGHARLILVGDVDQLPSVGPGAFLRDLIATNLVPAIRLDEVFRQAAHSGIVSNAHRIFRGEVPLSAAPDDEAADFYVIARQESEAAAELIVELVGRRIPGRFGLNARTDIQVLSPMHRGATGTMALNRSLQVTMNPHGVERDFGDRSFRIGDRVMQMRNDYEREVFNGDLGYVAQFEGDSTVLVQFDEHLVGYEANDVEQLSLAYATTIHKSQGSEYPAVVMPLMTDHFIMLSRHLLYTGVTRARRLCVLVAAPRAIQVALSQVRREERLTQLASRLEAALM